MLIVQTDVSATPTQEVVSDASNSQIALLVSFATMPSNNAKDLANSTNSVASTHTATTHQPHLHAFLKVAFITEIVKIDQIVLGDIALSLTHVALKENVWLVRCVIYIWDNVYISMIVALLILIALLVKYAFTTSESAEYPVLIIVNVQMRTHTAIHISDPTYVDLVTASQIVIAAAHPAVPTAVVESYDRVNLLYFVYLFYLQEKIL